MNTQQYLDRLRQTTAKLAGRAVEFGERARRVLGYSLIDDVLPAERKVAVSIEPGGFSIASGTRRFSRIMLQRVAFRPTGDDSFPSPEGLASGVDMALGELDLGSRDVILVIPKSWVVIKPVDLPLTVKENLSAAVSYELDRLTPLAAEDAVFDCIPVREKDGRVFVLVAAARAELVESYLTAFHARGLKVGSVTVSTSALGTLWGHAFFPAAVVCVEVGEKGYDASLVLRGLTASTVTESFNGLDPEARLEKVAAAATSVANLVETEVAPEVVIVPAPGSVEPGEIRRRLPLARMASESAGTALLVPEGTTNLPYRAVGGLLESLWPGASGINLLSRGIHRGKKKPMAITIALIAVILCMGLVYLVAPLRVEQVRLQEIERQLSAKKPEVRKVEALKKEVESLEGEIALIGKFKKDRPMALNLLKELTKVLPKTVWLTRVRISDSTVELEGYAATAADIVSTLEASPFFQKAEFASPTFRDSRLNADRFVVRMEIEGISKEEKQRATP